MKTPETLFSEREQRINAAIALKTLDRVPVILLSGFFPALYAGLTCKDILYDEEKTISAFSQFSIDFQPDMIDNPFAGRFIGAILDALDNKQLVWAGHGLKETGSFQFLEDEYMKADEYDRFLSDPTDFILRTYWPRVFGLMKPLENLPPLNDIISYCMGITKFAVLGLPEMADLLEKMTGVARASQAMLEGASRWADVSRRLGFPALSGSLTQAPFDTLSDFFRGTKGSMLDLYRRPEQVLAMTEKLLPIMIRMGLECKQRGNPRVFIPVHKGLDGFMSMEQFKIFFWPTLKRLLEALIQEGCNPMVFWEGDVTTRLELIADIPPGKAVYHFERTDMLRAKEILGGRVCIRGNVPLSLLVAGTPADVKAYCKQLIETVGRDGGFILDSATVIDDAKPENVRAMLDAVKEYGTYS